MKFPVGLLLLMPAMALAQGPFDGTWKSRIDSFKMSGKPDVFDVTRACITVPAACPR